MYSQALVYIFHQYMCITLNVLDVFETIFDVNCCAVRDLHAVPCLCALQKCLLLSKQGRVALQIYSINLFLSRWLVIAVGLVRAYLARGSYHGLYYSIEKPLNFFQTAALLEVSDLGAIFI